MACTKFQAREGTIAYSNSAVTYDAGTTLDGESFTANVNQAKNIVITIPEQDFEKIDCMGNLQQTIGANARTVGTATGVTPGYWQSQAMIVQSIGTAQATGTLVLSGDEQFVHVLSGGSSTATGGGSDTRYGVGTLSSGKAYDQNFLGAIRLFLNNGAQTMSIVMTNAYVKLGEHKPTGADGYYEVDFEVNCLAHDFAYEFQD